MDLKYDKNDAFDEFVPIAGLNQLTVIKTGIIHLFTYNYTICQSMYLYSAVRFNFCIIFTHCNYSTSIDLFATGMLIQGIFIIVVIME